MEEEGAAKQDIPREDLSHMAGMIKGMLEVWQGRALCSGMPQEDAESCKAASQCHHNNTLPNDRLQW